MSHYGMPPQVIGLYDTVHIDELCRYLYLPICMQREYPDEIRIPRRLERLAPLVDAAMGEERDWPYVYLTVARGWASPENPLNRPGWHCDGFGTEDVNYIWWEGPGTRFTVQEFEGISRHHVASMAQFEEQLDRTALRVYPEGTLLRLTPYVVHAVPDQFEPCWRTFVKISFSAERYNLLGNSHNYMFDYEWRMYERALLRNDPAYGEQDYYLDGHPGLSSSS